MKTNRVMGVGLMFAISVFTSLSCSIAQKMKRETKDVPEEFEFGRYRFDGGFVIEFREGLFWYHGHKSEKKRKYRLDNPSPEEWRFFWKSMNEVELWRWANKYENTDPNIMINDGEQWYLNIRNDEKIIFVTGGNCYPSDDDPRKSGTTPGDRTSRYSAFENAVRKLFELRNLDLTDQLSHGAIFRGRYN